MHVDMTDTVSGETYKLFVSTQQHGVAFCTTECEECFIQKPM